MQQIPQGLQSRSLQNQSPESQTFVDLSPQKRRGNPILHSHGAFNLIVLMQWILTKKFLVQGKIMLSEIHKK